MQRTLSEHISYLEEKIESLRKQLAATGQTASEQNGIEIDLGIAERALAHFQKAFDLEQRLKQKISN